MDINIEYVTEDESELVRKLTISREIDISLTLSVNVRDYFRGHRYVFLCKLMFADQSSVSLLSQFTISTNTHRHVRISDVELVAPKEGNIAIRRQAKGMQGIIVSEKMLAKLHIVTKAPDSKTGASCQFFV